MNAEFQQAHTRIQPVPIGFEPLHLHQVRAVLAEVVDEFGLALRQQGEPQPAQRKGQDQQYQPDGHRVIGQVAKRAKQTTHPAGRNDQGQQAEQGLCRFIDVMFEFFCCRAHRSILPYRGFRR